jgi:hypothetical protein
MPRFFMYNDSGLMTSIRKKRRKEHKIWKKVWKKAWWQNEIRSWRIKKFNYRSECFGGFSGGVLREIFFYTIHRQQEFQFTCSPTDISCPSRTVE